MEDIARVNGFNQGLSLGEASSRFLASLPVEERGVSQQEVYRFVRWYGWERPLAGLSAPEVANYAERLSLSDTDYEKKLELIRAFLAYVKKEGWSKINLAAHLKTKKAKARVTSSSRRNLPETVPFTPEGYAEMQSELTTLKEQRSQAIDEIRKAAADKDFRENAPLEAARERRGQLEGRIRELEEILKSAVVINEGEKPEAVLKVDIGDRIVLCDLVSGEELCYTIVSPREVAPAKGKISSVSPIGRAVIGQGPGTKVEVTVPAGKMRYEIKRVER